MKCFPQTISSLGAELLCYRQTNFPLPRLVSPGEEIKFDFGKIPILEMAMEHTGMFSVCRPGEEVVMHFDEVATGQTSGIEDRLWGGMG